MDTVTNPASMFVVSKTAGFKNKIFFIKLNQE